VPCHRLRICFSSGLCPVLCLYRVLLYNLAEKDITPVGVSTSGRYVRLAVVQLCYRVLLYNLAEKDITPVGVSTSGRYVRLAVVQLCDTAELQLCGLH